MECHTTTLNGLITVNVLGATSGSSTANMFSISSLSDDIDCDNDQMNLICHKKRPNSSHAPKMSGVTSTNVPLLPQTSRSNSTSTNRFVAPLSLRHSLQANRSTTETIPTCSAPSIETLRTHTQTEALSRTLPNPGAQYGPSSDNLDRSPSRHPELIISAYKLLLDDFNQFSLIPKVTSTQELRYTCRSCLVSDPYFMDHVCFSLAILKLVELIKHHTALAQASSAPLHLCTVVAGAGRLPRIPNDVPTRGACKQIKTSRIVCTTREKIRVLHNSVSRRATSSIVHSLLVHDIGAIIWSHCPMNTCYWRTISSSEKNDLVDEITTNFEIDSKDSRLTNYVNRLYNGRYREFKAELSAYYKLCKTHDDALANPPSEMLDRDVDQWMELCNHFNSDKRHSSTNIENRSKKKYNHRNGSRPLSYIVEEMSMDAVGHYYLEPVPSTSSTARWLNIVIHRVRWSSTPHFPLTPFMV
ncbi:Uncharacterized protein Fot_37570 [Forsythia ovata]|uniref:Uncharacterized protein n=1 Tax=Forsythia ovata TaxID=205694 RepID=A0ABD1S000_9LAMI